MSRASAWLGLGAVSLCLMAIWVAPAAAQAARRDWIVIVSPYVWAGSLKGDAALAGLTSKVDVPFSHVLDSLDFAAMGNVEVTNGLFGGYLDGFNVRTSQTERLAIGELGLAIQTTSVSAGVFYRAYDRQLAGNTVFGRARRFGLEPTVGLRWTRQEADLTSVLASGRVSESWTDAFIGLRLNVDLDARWNLAAAIDAGGFDADSSSYQAQAYLGYRTFLGRQPVILRIGYRLLAQDHRTTDFTGNTYRWNVTQQGPVIGASFQF